MKRAMIFGDSYSTFEGYIPDGYAIYYTKIPQIEGIDVDDASQCWWHLLTEDLGFEIVKNDSWSGSTVCFTGYEGDCTHSSFVTRLKRYIADGYFEKSGIDTVFVFGGTNDSWADAPIGDVDDVGEGALFSVKPAIRCFLCELRAAIPEGRIIVILNTEIKEEITECLASEGEAVRATVVRLSNIQKVSGHPDRVGMRQIYEQVKAAIT
ncbi:MAG: hypothetical protein IKL79_01495 [Clostridia bacterium]|nr:hypothetical protein [Clostridia bacterium]